MNKILELREKRAKLWDSTKAFLDSRRGENGLLSAEDTATYEKMEADDEFERTLIEALEEENIFRQLATNITTSSGDRKIPVVATKGSASRVDEEGAIPEADDAFGQVSIGAYKLATIIKVSEELINDSVFNLEQYIAKEFAQRIGAKVEEAFFVGDGTGKPTGIFNATGGAGVGVTTASASAITIDEIMDLFYSLKSPYRKNAVFVTNDATVKSIRKLKDGSGRGPLGL